MCSCRECLQHSGSGHPVGGAGRQQQPCTSSAFACMRTASHRLLTRLWTKSMRTGLPTRACLARIVRWRPARRARTLSRCRASSSRWHSRCARPAIARQELCSALTAPHMQRATYMQQQQQLCETGVRRSCQTAHVCARSTPACQPPPPPRCTPGAVAVDDGLGGAAD